MPELLANNAASTLTAAIPDAVTTSCTVANGSVFPATGNFRIIVDSELMLCTARAANVLTITRGVETTTAVAHSNGAAVTHVLTKGGLDQYLAELSYLGGWSTYTPTWTSGGTPPAIGNGILTGKYVQIGKTTHWWMTMIAGSTTTFGNTGNAWTITLPLTAGSNNPLIGVAHANHAGAIYQGMFIKSSTTIVVPATINAASGTMAAWASNVPFVWANGDFLQLSGTYEAA